METKYIILIVVAVVIGACAGFYGAMKALERRSARKKEVDVVRLPELTSAYVKDWIQVELDGQTGRSASVVLLRALAPEDRINLEGVVPEELQQDTEHLLLILIRDDREILKSRVIQFETVADELASTLENAGGILNIQK